MDSLQALSLLATGRFDGICGHETRFEDPVRLNSLHSFWFKEFISIWKNNSFRPLYLDGIFYYLSCISHLDEARAFYPPLVDFGSFFCMESSKDLFKFNKIWDHVDGRWNSSRRMICREWYKRERPANDYIEQKNRYNHKDLITLSHPDPDRYSLSSSSRSAHNALIRMLLGKSYSRSEVPLLTRIGHENSNTIDEQLISYCLNNGIKYRVFSNHRARRGLASLRYALKNIDTDVFRDVKYFEYDEVSLETIREFGLNFAGKMNPLECLIVSRNTSSELLASIMKEISSRKLGPYFSRSYDTVSFSVEFGKFTAGKHSDILSESDAILDALKSFGKITDDGRFKVLIECIDEPVGNVTNTDYDIVFSLGKLHSLGNHLTFVGFKPVYYDILATYLSGVDFVD